MILFENDVCRGGGVFFTFLWAGAYIMQADDVQADDLPGGRGGGLVWFWFVSHVPWGHNNCSTEEAISNFLQILQKR